MCLFWIQASEVSPYWQFETQPSDGDQKRLSNREQFSVGSTLAVCKYKNKPKTQFELYYTMQWEQLQSHWTHGTNTVRAIPVAFTSTSLLSPLMGWQMSHAGDWKEVFCSPESFLNAAPPMTAVPQFDICVSSGDGCNSHWSASGADLKGGKIWIHSLQNISQTLRKVNIKQYNWFEIFYMYLK